MASSTQDDVDQFLIEAQRIVNEAQFVVDSIPNADIFAVERCLRKLASVQLVLQSMDDTFISPERIIAHIDHIATIYNTLQEYLHSANGPTRRDARQAQQTGRRGRPRLDINLERAIELHDLGNTWENIALAFGVVRQTLYNHMERAGISTARPAYSEISDEDLDAHISHLSREHPFVGQRVMQGHLTAMGIKVSLERVQYSLQRVDAIGVVLR
jgi:hypothetical protein